MDVFSSIFEFLADKSKQLSSKAALIISFLVILILADNIFGYTYFNTNNKKIEQVKEINEVLKDTSLPENIKNYFTALRQNVIDHKNIKNYLSDFFTNISFTNSKNIKTPIPINANPISNNLLHFISSSWMTLLTMLFMFIIYVSIIFEKNSPSFWKPTTSIIVVEIILISLAFLQSKLFSLIPLINNNHKINYLINTILSFIIIFIPFYILSNFLKKRLIKIKQEVNKANG